MNGSWRKNKTVEKEVLTNIFTRLEAERYQYDVTKLDVVDEKWCWDCQQTFDSEEFSKHQCPATVQSMASTSSSDGDDDITTSTDVTISDDVIVYNSNTDVTKSGDVMVYNSKTFHTSMNELIQGDTMQRFVNLLKAAASLSQKIQVWLEIVYIARPIDYLHCKWQKERSRSLS